MNNPQTEKEFLRACLVVLRTIKQVVGDRAGNRDKFRESVQVLEDIVIIRRTEIEDQEIAHKIQESPRHS